MDRGTIVGFRSGSARPDPGRSGTLHLHPLADGRGIPHRVGQHGDQARGAGEITRGSPSHGSLCSEDPAAEAIASYPLRNRAPVHRPFPLCRHRAHRPRRRAHAHPYRGRLEGGFRTRGLQPAAHLGFSPADDRPAGRRARCPRNCPCSSWSPIRSRRSPPTDWSAWSRMCSAASPRSCWPVAASPSAARSGRFPRSNGSHAPARVDAGQSCRSPRA